MTFFIIHLTSAMKKKSSLLLILPLLISIAASSQSLTFCERVDGSGAPINSNTVFSVNKNGSPVTFYFVLPAGYNSSSINFDVYRLNQEKEVFHSTIKQPVSASQKSVSKQMTFYDAGTYRIYVFDDKDRQLAKGELTIKKSAQ
ncbi:MAG: hypothetical protein ACHQD9_01925 [Chitinophagales bacterium]